jgi:hypothetical protein
MSLPNPSAIITTLPGAMRVTVRRGAVTATVAARTNTNDSGSMSAGGIESELRTVLWTLGSAFSPAIRIADVLYFDTIPATVETPCIVAGVGPNTAGLLQRSLCLVLSDTVTLDGKDCACKIGAIAQDIVFEASGFRPDDMQGLFIPVALLPDPSQLPTTGTPCLISGAAYTVQRCSLDARRGVCCLTVKRGGAE